MKLNQILLPVLAGSLFAVTGRAQVSVTITGSTAFRSITEDRAQSLFDPGYTSWGDLSGVLPETFSGTMTNVLHSTTTVNLRLSFSGSGAGMNAVDQDTPVPTIDPGTGFTNNLTPDIAMSDVFPESATPPVNTSDLNITNVGVIPFVWIRSTALTGITNITREQAYLLMTDSGVQFGVNGMPATFLGGSSTNPVYLTGRDSGSGTHITTQADVGFYNNTPVLWGLNGGVLVQTNGYSSAGLERAVIYNTTNVVGYIGVADAYYILTNGLGGVIMSYEGVPYSVTNVQNGAYPMWGYEHLANKKNALSPSQQAIHDALVSAITDLNFQTTNSLYNSQFVDQTHMKVQRGTDGAPITGLNF